MNAPNLETILENARSIAVVGLSNDPHRDSYTVSEYLERHGYTIIPVNPNIEEWKGHKAYPDLQSVPEPIDIVNIFRRPEYVPDIVDAAIEVSADAIWMQLGVRSDEGKRKADEAGIPVVMDRCIKIEHANMR